MEESAEMAAKAQDCFAQACQDTAALTDRERDVVETQHLTLDLTEPRLIAVTAYGPLANLQAANTASATQWMIPGKHITAGDA